MKFKKGDIVIVVRADRSDASNELLGQTFVVWEARESHVTSGPDCGGLWNDEVELSPVNDSPLMKALS